VSLCQRRENDMQRRSFIFLLGGAISSALTAHAQKKALPMIGFLGIGSPAGFAREVAAFLQGVKDSGWTIGENVAIEYRWAEGQAERLPELAGELVKRNVALIVTSGGTPAARAAKTATATIPIVFETGIDPVEAGLVRSFAHPDGNLTGITIATGELNPKRIDLLADLVPNARVIAMLVNSKNIPSERFMSRAQEAAQAKSVQLAVLKAGSETEFETAFASLAGVQAGALLVGNDPFFYSRRDQLVDLAARYRMPAMYEWREFTAIGGLSSYGTSIVGMYRRLGSYAGRVLSGEKPADLPIEQPTKFEWVINLNTAKALGLTVPLTLLARAGEVIE
jgi:putative ABC transport system substrate-binding protein